MILALLIFLPMLAAPVVWLTGKKRESWTEIAAATVTGAELVLSAFLFSHPSTMSISAVFPEGLHFRVDGFRQVYCLLAALLWFMTTLFGKQYFRHEREGIAGYWFFNLMTLGATEGLFLAADFASAFCFFEILSLCSFPWVAQERNPEAVKAAKTYLTVAVVGGLVLLMGLFLLKDGAGTLEFERLEDAMRNVPQGRKIAAGILILLGFGAKAGMFPLHIWLPKAHPVAPAPASALLSGMLTKVGVFGILHLSMHALGTDEVFGLILLILAVITMTLGAVLAVFSENLKRTLACSSMSQIGFILTGIATAVLAGSTHNHHAAELALNGTMLHMVNHSLLKLLLFLSAGAVAMNLHKLKLEDIQGWGRKRNLLKVCFLTGLIGIGGIPGFNGYISKTLLHEGLAHLIEEGTGPVWLYRISEALFLFSGGLTFAYMLRLFICVFVSKNKNAALQAAFDRQEKPAYTPLSAAVLAISAFLILVMSIPGFATSLGARMTGMEPVHFEVTAWENLKGALISLSIGTAVYLGFIRPILLTGKMKAGGRIDLDEQFYKPLLFRWLPGILGVPARILGENMVLSRFPVSVPAGIARVMGENLVLIRIAKAAVLVGSAIGRFAEESLDWITWGLRRTALKEEEIHTRAGVTHRISLSPFFRATVMAFSRVADNFSYAMMMVCIGIVLVFVLIILGLMLR